MFSQLANYSCNNAFCQSKSHSARKTAYSSKDKMYNEQAFRVTFTMVHGEALRKFIIDLTRKNRRIAWGLLETLRTNGPIGNVGEKTLQMVRSVYNLHNGYS